MVVGVAAGVAVVAVVVGGHWRRSKSRIRKCRKCKCESSSSKELRARFFEVQIFQSLVSRAVSCCGATGLPSFEGWQLCNLKPMI